MLKLGFWCWKCEGWAQWCCHILGSVITCAITEGRISKYLDQLICRALGPISGFAQSWWEMEMLMQCVVSSICLINCTCLTFGNFAYPDEKIKLWLFLPGRHSSVVETAQAAVSKLRGMCYSWRHCAWFNVLYNFFTYLNTQTWLWFIQINSFLLQFMCKLDYSWTHSQLLKWAVFHSHFCSVAMSFFTIVVASGLWISPGDSEEVAAALSQALRNCIERSFSLTHWLYAELFVYSYSNLTYLRLAEP